MRLFTFSEGETIQVAAPRSNSSMDSSTDFNSAGNYLDDLYTFDARSLGWTNLTSPSRGNPPSGRAGAIFAPVNNLIFLFGGFQLSGVHDASPCTYCATLTSAICRQLL